MPLATFTALRGVIATISKNYMSIIDGKKIAERILREVTEGVAKLSRPLKMAAILIGDDPKSKKFLELKKKAAESVGVDFDFYEFSADVKTRDLVLEVEKIAQDTNYGGILIELPIPEGIDMVAVLNAVPLKKDVDVLSFEAQENFYSGDFSILPPAVEAVKSIFEDYKIEAKNKKAVVFGQGVLVGKPVSFWLEKQGSLVAAIDEFTKNSETYSREADILIAGVGKINLIKEGMVKEGAVVIDFGPDVDFESVSKKASFITPPMGGVGPIVIAAVLKNLVNLNLS